MHSMPAFGSLCYCWLCPSWILGLGGLFWGAGDGANSLMIAADRAVRKPFATWRNNSHQYGFVQDALFCSSAWKLVTTKWKMTKLVCGKSRNFTSLVAPHLTIQPFQIFPLAPVVLMFPRFWKIIAYISVLFLNKYGSLLHGVLEEIADFLLSSLFVSSVPVTVHRLAYLLKREFKRNK